MTRRLQKPYECCRDLFNDDIKNYSDLIKNKDALIHFITCMLEHNQFQYINKEFVNDFFNMIAEDEKANRKPFSSWHEYGIPDTGEI